MLISTSYRPSEQQRAEAQEAADMLGWTRIERGNDTLVQLRKRHRDTFGECPQMLILAEQTWRWYANPCVEEMPVYFHPSMAHVRVKRLMRGENDVLLQIAGIVPGESILDCTAGMGSDAIVLSYAVGHTGKVVALESTAPLAFLLRRGLKMYQTDIQPLYSAMRRIDVVHDEHYHYLMSLPDHSYDVVYFDPMFRLPPEQANVIGPLRNIVNDQPLELRVIKEAKRVARRLVVMKEMRRSAEFERLGFEPIASGSSKIQYGVIRL